MLRVLKFGGTSVGTPTHILAVSRRILHYHEAGDAILVVVSAMGQTTDELLLLAHRVSRTPPRRELDMLLTAGERISMALLAMALGSHGCPAISFTGSQSGIVTSDTHSDARIQTVRPHRIEEELARGRVVIVAGFQGVSLAKEVTTLGRGGSDTTAVALAIRFGADVCEIYTDVSGVLTADPRIVPTARHLDSLTYDPMVAFAHFGGRVLFHRAVVLARKYGLALRVRSSIQEGDGTLIRDGRPRTTLTEENEPMESNRILGIALESPVYWVRVTVPAGEPCRLPFANAAKGSGAPAPRSLLFSHQGMPNEDRILHWVCPSEVAIEDWIAPGQWSPHARVQLERDAALVTVVGEAAAPEPELASRIETILEEAKIPLWGLQSGAHSLSALTTASEGERAARVLHDSLIGKREI
ncbi:MAG: aspartate kinase [Candidatus Eisenbacteria bacterium]